MEAVRSEWVVLARVLLAALLGGVLGWERLSAGKWAGVRTLMLVALSSALFVGVTGLVAGDAVGAPQSIRVDPIRVVQAVAIGIGFLGAGIIHLDRNGDGVRGLTTAACVWATAALGIAVGLGRYALAVGTTLILLFILRVIGRFEPTSKE